MGKYLGADQILESNDREFFEVECPEWGGTVRCRTLTATERDSWEASMDKDSTKGAAKNRLNARAHLISKVIVDEHGARLFTKYEHVVALGQKSIVPINRIFNLVMERSKVTKEDLEELEGNSESGPSEGTATV